MTSHLSFVHVCALISLSALTLSASATNLLYFCLMLLSVSCPPSALHRRPPFWLLIVLYFYSILCFLPSQRPPPTSSFFTSYCTSVFIPRCFLPFQRPLPTFSFFFSFFSISVVNSTQLLTLLAPSTDFLLFRFLLYFCRYSTIVFLTFQRLILTLLLPFLTTSVFIPLVSF